MDYFASPHVDGQGCGAALLAAAVWRVRGCGSGRHRGAFLSVPVLALVRILYRRIRQSAAYRAPGWAARGGMSSGGLALDGARAPTATCACRIARARSVPLLPDAKRDVARRVPHAHPHIVYEPVVESKVALLY